ncbi:MAG: nucleotidyltransferase family protein [Ignavibacteriaceae bacterium]
MDILTKYSIEIKDFCKVNKIKKLSLYGSYSKNTYNEESDIDLLVEFEENTGYGLLDIARIERELSEITGKKVDLRTPEELSMYFRDKVVKEALVKYEG